MDKALKVLKRLEKLSEKEFLPSIGPVKGKILAEVIKKYKPKKILEIGALYGYSAILMARLLPESGKVIMIEIDKESARIARENINDAGLNKKIKVLVGDGLEIIPKLKGIFNLLFIDAAKEEYFKYLKLAEKNLAKASVVAADNVEIFKNHMLDYLDYVRSSNRYKSRTVKVQLEFSRKGDAMEISEKID